MIKSVPLFKRFIAYVIDLVVIFVLISLVGNYQNPVLEDFLTNGINEANLEQVEALKEALFGYLIYYFSVFVPIYLSYHTFFVWYFGATLGKIFMKIRVVSSKDDFCKPNFSQSLIRAIFRLLSDIFFYLGFISIFTNQARLGFHDKISNSVVISD